MANRALIERLLRGTESQDSSAANEEHLRLINLPVFVCDEAAGSKAHDHSATPGCPEARRGCLFFLHTAEPLPKG